MPVQKAIRLFFKSSHFQKWLVAFTIGPVIICTVYFMYWYIRPVYREIKTLLDKEENITYIKVSNSQKGILTAEREVSDYYQENNYPLKWISMQGELLPHGKSMINRIRTANLDGLNSSDYHLAEIELGLCLIEKKYRNSDSDRVNIASLDILLTDAYYTYASHQYAGRIHTSRENIEWAKHIIQISPFDSLGKLTEGIGIDSILNLFACPHIQYRLLQKKLQDCYDSSQTSWLNFDSIPFEEQITRISLNMERWRWMPRKMPELYIMANIAGFSLQVSDHSIDTLNMKIIAGKLEQPTPMFSAKMVYIILNPWWEIPASIARKEMLPAIKKDRSFFTRNHIKVFKYSGKALSEVAANDIDWKTVSSANFNYQLRQTPGPWNALGKVKFIFPNKYNVYFHDTPNRELFSSEVRTFSHGCIRIEKPVELAAYLLEKEKSWTTEKIDKKDELLLKVGSAPIVYICYWTARVDSKGHLSYTPDIYGYDKKLEELLNGGAKPQPILSLHNHFKE